MNIRMIALDLDGTLLNLERKVSEENRDALHACMERGIQVVLASGRSFVSVQKLAVENGIEGPIISNNGARVDLSSQGPILEEHAYPLELARAVFDTMKKSGVYFVCYGHGTLFQNNTEASRLSTRRGVNMKDQLVMHTHRVEQVVSDESRTIQEGLIEPYKFVAFSDNAEKLEGLRRTLREAGLPLNISSSWFDNIEVMVESAGKDVAIRVLRDHFKLEADQVMAFGDNLNDIDMLKAAGVPVAMENALDQVKAHAKIIAPHHDNSGVAKVLREYVLK